MLGAALSGEAMAVDVASVSCSFSGGVLDELVVIKNQASAGVTLPPSCALGGSCSQCYADLLTNRFTLQASNPLEPSQLLFLFSRGGGGAGQGAGERLK